MARSCEHRKGRNIHEQWVTGQRVPVRGTWVDQYGRSTRYERGSTFLMTESPVLGPEGKPMWVCAHRFLARENPNQEAA